MNGPKSLLAIEPHTILERRWQDQKTPIKIAKVKLGKKEEKPPNSWVSTTQHQREGEGKEKNGPERLRISQTDLADSALAGQLRNFQLLFFLLSGHLVRTAAAAAAV